MISGIGFLTSFFFYIYIYILTCIIYITETKNGNERTWFWIKEADDCADLLYWVRDSGQGIKAYGDAGLLCWFPGSEKKWSRWWWWLPLLFPSFWKSKEWLNSSVGVAFSDGHSAPLLVSPSLCFLSSCSLPLPLSSLHSLLFLLSRCLLPFLPFCPVLSSCFLFLSSLVPPLSSAVHPLAFIARGCRRFLFVVAGME